MRRLAIWLLVGLCALAAFFARPPRYEIDGLSMAPALLPGDIVSSGWLPQADRLTPPRRFQRWLVTAPDGRPAIKRVVGLPGETASLIAGDLAIDGAVVLTPPDALAELASPVAAAAPHDGGWQRTFAAPAIYDDAPFAPHESRRLLPVRDVGLAAIVDATSAAPLEAAIRLGPRAVRWRLTTPARHALVAGRLDGRLVAAAWLLPAESALASGRSPLPPRPPRQWPIAEPWPEGVDGPPLLGLRLARDGEAVRAADCDSLVLACTVWRDILHRPPADGTTEWRLGPSEVFVLGDFPSGSRDSRHWGPVAVDALHHRVQSGHHHFGEPSSCW